MIPLEHLLQHPVYLALVLRVVHIDKVYDDDATEVSEPQLPADSTGGLQVGLEDGLFQIPVADKRAGIDINGGHRFGLVDDDVTTGFQLYLAAKCLLDLVLDRIQIKNRRSEER